MNYLVYIKGFKEKSAKEVCMSLREWCELFISGESAPVTPSSDDLVDKMKNLMNKEDDFEAGPSSAAEREEKEEEISSELPG